MSHHLISWVNFLYFKLGSIPIWLSKEEILETMPTSFKKTYPNTRCMIDCTELFCQSPCSLNTQSCLYSSYKSHITDKSLVGIAPSGAEWLKILNPNENIVQKWVKGKCSVSQVGQFFATSLLGYFLIFVRNSPCLKLFSGKAVCHNISSKCLLLFLMKSHAKNL